MAKKGRIIGFYTRKTKDGRKVVCPITKSRGIRTKRRIVKYGVSRSSWAWYVDSLKRARIVLSEPSSEWRKHPGKLDFKGVDTPGAVSTEKPWMEDEPFTKDEVQMYNYFSHFDVDINKEFKDRVKLIEADVKRRLEEYGIGSLPPDVEKALYYYRKALYEYYLEDSRARSIAPPVSVVGPSKYQGNLKRAEKIREKAIEKVERAKRFIEKAIKKHIKGKLPVHVKRTIQKSKLKTTDFRGVKLKKDLGLQRALQSYHYKYKNGTGSVLMVLWKGPWEAYQLGYHYSKDGTVYRVEAGKYGGAMKRLSVKTYGELKKELEKLMKGR